MSEGHSISLSLSGEDLLALAYRLSVITPEMFEISYRGVSTKHPKLRQL
jgi:hypothetical protein